MGKAQGPAGDTLRFTLDRTGGAISHYSIEVDRSTRKGTFQGSGTTPAAGVTGSAASDSVSSAKNDAVSSAKNDAVSSAKNDAVSSAKNDAVGSASGQPVAISEEIARKVFAAGPLVRSNRCESHRKGIAQTGTKTLQLVQNGTAFTCTFNYSEEDRVNTAATVFEALAETMEAGQRLAGKLRFDRLGLDAEMELLESALAEGRALEVGNIAPVLEQIQNDERVMDRVRRKAAHLLQSAGLPAVSLPENGSSGAGR